MRKLPLLSAILFISVFSLFSQDSKFRFGLRIAGQPSWLRSNNLNKVSPDGTVFGWGFGLVMDWRLTDVAYFSTGIGGDFEGGFQKFGDSLFYVVDKEDNIIEYNNVSLNSSNNSTFMLQRRELQTTCVTIPLILKLCTKEIGGFKYFGEFGGSLGFLVKTRATDEVQTIFKNGVFQSYLPNTREDVNPYNATIPIRLGLNVGIGTEYTLSGSTNAFASINYIHQFFNTYWESSDYYARYIRSNNSKLETNGYLSAYSSCVQINLGIMF